MQSVRESRQHHIRMARQGVQSTLAKRLEVRRFLPIPEFGMLTTLIRMSSMLFRVQIRMKAK